MEKAKFWVDFALEAGDGGVCKRCGFEVEFTDEKYEELYQVWFDNKCELNNWDCNWDGHEELLDELNGIAYHCLNEWLKKYDPALVDPLDAYWEISEETEKAF